MFRVEIKDSNNGHEPLYSFSEMDYCQADKRAMAAVGQFNGLVAEVHEVEDDDSTRLVLIARGKGEWLKLQPTFE